MQNPIIKALHDELTKERTNRHLDWALKLAKRFDVEMSGTELKSLGRIPFHAGHEAATARLLGVVERALEVIEFYSNRHSWDDTNVIYKYDVISDEDLYIDSYDKNKCGGKKAREFLTTLANIKKDAK